MTREDAIYEIRQLAVLSTNKNIERITEALNMAIEALQDEIWKPEPQKTADYCDTCNHKGCAYCVGDNSNPYCVPSRYEPKDEPNSSEKPNNCETCEHWNDTEDGCADRHGCKGEPQTDCLTCRYNSDEWDSPKCDGCSKAHSNYEPQLVKDCTTCKYHEAVSVVCGRCDRHHSKYEPQTDCAWR